MTEKDNPKKYFDELFEKFIKTINIPAQNTKQLFSIGLIGLTGSGKSTVAKMIGEKLNLFVGSNDSIRRFLNDEGFPGENPNQEMLQKIAEKASEFLYENKISHIIDADLIKFHENAKENAQNHKAKFYLIFVKCPEEIIFKRLEERNEKILQNPASNLSRVGKEEYLKRKKLHDELGLPEDIFFTIDNSENLSKQVDDLAAKLIEEKVL